VDEQFAQEVLGDSICNSGPNLARHPMDMLRIKLGKRWAYRYRERILMTRPDIYPSREIAEDDLKNIEVMKANIFNTPTGDETFVQEAVAIYSKSIRKRRDEITENVNLWEDVACRFG
jgi:hypothetical protein